MIDIGLTIERQSEPTINAAYFAATNGLLVHFLFEELGKHMPERGIALELGFGSGNGVLWLLEHGFEVVAIDIEPMAIETLLPRLPRESNVRLIEADFAKVDFPKVDVLVAGFSLFMLPKSKFPKVWRKIKFAVKRGGLVAITLFGIRDEWNDGNRTMHSARGARALFRDFDILFWQEHEKEGKTVVDLAKYWHVFHVVAKKR